MSLRKPAGRLHSIEHAGRLYTFRGDTLETVELSADVPPGHLWLSVSDAARWVGVGRRNLWVQIERGVLRCRRTRDGRQGAIPTVFVSIIELDAWDRSRLKRPWFLRHWHKEPPLKQPAATPERAYAKHRAKPRKKVARG